MNEKPIYMTGDVEIRPDVVVTSRSRLQWNDGYTETTYTFANNINTTEGGTHLSGFRSALTRTINQYASRNNLADKLAESVTGDDIREGMTAVDLGEDPAAAVRRARRRPSSATPRSRASSRAS